MPEKKLQPDNPCRFSPSETIPAKIWELLRRNKEFLRRVAHLDKLDRRLIENPQDADARSESLKMLLDLDGSHDFGRCALEWLIPEPDFVISDRDGEIVEQRTSPDSNNISDSGSVSGIEQVQILRRGPLVMRHVQDLDDAFSEWKGYEPNKVYRLFDCSTPWRNTPEGFRRQFRFLSRQIDTRSVNPVTGDRSDAPVPHETDFFKGWSLSKAFTEIAERGQPTEEQIAKAVMFDDLTTNYRALVVPKSIRFVGEANDALKALQALLNDGLSCVRELLGTERAWDDFIFVDNQLKGRTIASRQRAILTLLEELYIDREELLEIRAAVEEKDPEDQKEAAEILRRFRQVHEADVSGRVGQIEHLRDSIFPKFDLKTLEKPPAQRRGSTRRSR